MMPHCVGLLYFLYPLTGITAFRIFQSTVLLHKSVQSQTSLCHSNRLWTA